MNITRAIQRWSMEMGVLISVIVTGVLSIIFLTISPDFIHQNIALLPAGILGIVSYVLVEDYLNTLDF